MSQNNNKSVAKPSNRNQFLSHFFNEPFFHDPFWPSFDFDTRVAHASVDWVPKVDVKDNETAIVIHADLPGMKKDDIHIDVDEKSKTVTLSGEYKKHSEEKKENYYMSERSHGKFERKFRMPESADLNNIKAALKDGVLDVTIAKKSLQEAPQTKKVAVN